MARHLITSALPYINGIKHLGNLVGSQLPADLYARYLRARGHEVMFICATDEHGTPAELAAGKTGEPVARYCARMHRIQADLARGFGLSFDHYGRSSSDRNRRLTQHFAGKLADNGYIREVAEKQVYSIDDGRFLPDRYIEGTCPNCGYDKARGDQCENCTKQLDPTDLIDPRSAISGSTNLEVRETKHLYLCQSGMRDQLNDWIDSKADWRILTTSIARKWLNDGDGLQDRGITRDLDWGIPVKKGDADWPGMEGKVFYVWFDAPIEYIACAGEWAEAGGLSNFYHSHLIHAKSNVLAGTWYLKKLMGRYQHTDDPIAYALADYNAGRSRVLDWNTGAAKTNSALFIEQIGYPSTKAYVQAVKLRREKYRDFK